MACLVNFFFNDTATTEIYTLSLHDALPISRRSAKTATSPGAPASAACSNPCRPTRSSSRTTDRKSTRLNSSHANISYAVFCLKKKKLDDVNAVVVVVELVQHDRMEVRIRPA